MADEEKISPELREKIQLLRSGDWSPSKLFEKAPEAEEMKLIDPILVVNHLPADSTVMLGEAIYNAETNTLTVWVAPYVYDCMVHFERLTKIVIGGGQLTAENALSGYKVDIEQIPTCTFYIPSQDQIEQNGAEQVADWKFNRGARLPTCTNENVIAAQHGDKTCTAYPGMTSCPGFTPSAWEDMQTAWIDDAAIAHVQRKFISCHVPQYQTVIGENVQQHASRVEAETLFITEMEALRDNDTQIIITTAEKDRVKYLEKVLV